MDRFGRYSFLQALKMHEIEVQGGPKARRKEKLLLNGLNLA